MTSESMEATLQRLYSGRTAFKDAVRVASTSNVALSGAQTVDGVALVAGDRVLLTGQTSSAQNGVYVVATGAWARAADLSVNAHARLGMIVNVLEGTSNSGLWALSSPTTGTITLGTTALTFTTLSGGGGGGTPSDTDPEDVADFTTGPSPGVGTDYSRADHVHAIPYDWSTDATASTVALRTSEGSIKSVAPVAIGTAGKYLGLMGGGAAVSGVVTPTKPTLISSGDTRARLGEGGAELELSNDGNDGVVFRSFDGLGSPAYIGVDISAFILGDSIGSYSKTETPAAAYAILYGSDVTSVSDTISARPSGVGASRTLLSGLGAAGSASGNFTAGLPGGNTALGAAARISVGTLVANVSDPLSVCTEASGTYTPILNILQPFAGYGRITTPGAVNLSIFTANLLALGSNSGVSVDSTNITFPSAQYVLNSGQDVSTPDSVAFAASLTIDMHQSNDHVIGTLTANITSLTLSNALNGSQHRLWFTQDATGGRTVTFNANFIASAAYAASVDGTANNVTMIEVTIVATNKWRITNRQVFSS